MRKENSIMCILVQQIQLHITFQLCTLGRSNYHPDFFEACVGLVYLLVFSNVCAMSTVVEWRNTDLID